jgi:hypothetical protein
MPAGGTNTAHAAVPLVLIGDRLGGMSRSLAESRGARPCGTGRRTGSKRMPTAAKITPSYRQLQDLSGIYRMRALWLGVCITLGEAYAKHPILALLRTGVNQPSRGLLRRDHYLLVEEGA